MPVNSAIKGIGMLYALTMPGCKKLHIRAFNVKKIHIKAVKKSNNSLCRLDKTIENPKIILMILIITIKKV